MSREIKFRIWVKNGNVFLPATYGDGQKLPAAPLMDSDGNLYCWGSQHWGVDNELENPDEFIVQQFTGLKDVRGQEIFEGDILQHDSGRGELNEGIGPVYWDTDGWHWESQCLGERSDYVTIIGNICENPELNYPVKSRG